ncbi:MAG TPA: hypothetical protein VJS17_02910, partial [Pyrinomonadaceae bacterium]|nr:hypothetical protein [Pyrinomonadaceae bacterium]
VSGFSSVTTPVTLSEVIAGSGFWAVVCAAGADLLISRASRHSTPMLPNFLIVTLCFYAIYAQLIPLKISTFRRSKE